MRLARYGPAFHRGSFERAGGATSYKQYINEITRIRLQPCKTQEQRDEEARKFAVNEYPRNMVVEKVSTIRRLASGSSACRR